MVYFYNRIMVAYFYGKYCRKQPRRIFFYIVVFKNWTDASPTNCINIHNYIDRYCMNSDRNLWKHKCANNKKNSSELVKITNYETNTKNGVFFSVIEDFDTCIHTYTQTHICTTCTGLFLYFVVAMNNKSSIPPMKIKRIAYSRLHQHWRTVSNL